MSGNPSHKFTGAFVLGAIALIVTGLIVFGSGKLFQTRVPAMMFFSEPVTGLDIGAPVLFNGVRVGVVTDIDLVWNLSDNSFQTPVRIDFMPETLRYSGASQEEIETVRRGEAQVGEALIERGLRAQLSVSSILTGKLQINLVMRPAVKANFVLEGEGKGRVLEIPTVRSDIAEVRATVQSVMAKLSDMPLEEIIENLNGTLVAARTILESPQIEAGVAEVRETAAEARRVMVSIEAQLDPLLRSLRATSEDAGGAVREAEALFTDSRQAVARLESVLQDARTAVERIQRLAATAGGVIEAGSPLQKQLNEALAEFSRASRAVRSLADTLERNPNSVLFGR